MIVGNICQQCPRFKVYQTSSEDFCLNKRINYNYEDLNEDFNLVDGEN